MKTSLITRDEMIEAIEQHTGCITTREIPSVVANYFMITKRFYAQSDKTVIRRILIAEIRDYLLEEGRIHYAAVAAEKRKEVQAEKRKEVQAEKRKEVQMLKLSTKSKETFKPTAAPVSDTSTINNDCVLPILIWQGVRVVTTETLAKGYGTEPVRIRKNAQRNKDRFKDGIHFFNLTSSNLIDFKNRVSERHSVGKNAKALTLWTERGAARMSKIVDTDEAWAFFEKLEDSYFRQKQSSPTPAIPQSLPEALRLAAELAEQKERLEQRQLQLEEELHLAAPKVEFAERVGTANGILIGNFAKVIGLKQNHLFRWLRENKILIASGSRRNVPMQQYIDQGYFSVREVVIDDEQYHRIALTTHITGKGQQWLTRKLLDAGLLKPVPSN